MRWFGLVLLVAFVTFTTPTGNAGPIDLSRPVAAFVVTSGSGASITWTPGVVAPDYYVILGGPVGDLSPIRTVPGTQFSWTDDTTYPSYAVESETAGVTSDPVIAGEIDAPPCTSIDLYPPAVHDGCNPGTGPAKASILLDVPGLL